VPVRFGEEKRLCASYSIPDGARLCLNDLPFDSSSNILILTVSTMGFEPMTP
jgi:hypothetical protein